MPVPDAAAQGVSYTAPSVIEPELGGRIERRYTVTQTVTTVRACSYTQAEVEALLEAHRGRGEDDLGEALRAAILDARRYHRPRGRQGRATQLHVRSSTSNSYAYEHPAIGPSPQVKALTAECVHGRLI